MRNGGKNREVLLSLVSVFNDAQRDVRVVPTYQGDYFESLAKLRTALVARAAPAITHVIGEVLPYLAEAGVLTPMDRFGAASSFGLDAGAGAGGVVHGGGERPLWGLPFNRSTPIAYLNGDVLKEMGEGAVDVGGAAGVCEGGDGAGRGWRGVAVGVCLSD
ncbi:MAG: hypothetical protein R3F14_02845 [Polyangiaceae bacterium]